MKKAPSSMFNYEQKKICPGKFFESVVDKTFHHLLSSLDNKQSFACFIITTVCPSCNMFTPLMVLPYRINPWRKTRGAFFKPVRNHPFPSKSYMRNIFPPSLKQYKISLLPLYHSTISENCTSNTSSHVFLSSSKMHMYMQ